MSPISGALRYRVVFTSICTLVLFLVAFPATAQDTSDDSDAVGDLVGQLVGTLAPPSEEPSGTGGVKRGVCESKDRKRGYCPVDTSGGVRLVRQISRSSCTDNWGFDANGIWVINGCRAEFEVGAPVVEPTPVPTPDTEPTIPREKIICGSATGHRVSCAADTSAGVELVKTLSSNPCLGHWGYDSTGIWVDGGCRGEFSVAMSEIVPTPIPMPKLKTVKCKSVSGRQAFCSADTSNGVRLVRKLGRATCDDNWGFDTNGIWVANNCHGEFELGEPTVTGPSLVVCRATTSAKEICSARVTTSIRLVRQLSRAKCINNWGFGDNGIWVRNGCQAEFEVE